MKITTWWARLGVVCLFFAIGAPVDVFARSADQSNCSNPSFFCSEGKIGIKTSYGTIARLIINFKETSFTPSKCTTSGVSGWSTGKFINLIYQYLPQFRSITEAVLDAKFRNDDIVLQIPVKQLSRFYLTCDGKTSYVDIDVPDGVASASPGVNKFETPKNITTAIDDYVETRNNKELITISFTATAVDPVVKVFRCEYKSFANIQGGDQYHKKYQLVIDAKRGSGACVIAVTSRLHGTRAAKLVEFKKPAEAMSIEEIIATAGNAPPIWPFSLIEESIIKNSTFGQKMRAPFFSANEKNSIGSQLPMIYNRQLAESGDDIRYLPILNTNILMLPTGSVKVSVKNLPSGTLQKLGLSYEDLKAPIFSDADVQFSTRYKGSFRLIYEKDPAKADINISYQTIRSESDFSDPTDMMFASIQESPLIGKYVNLTQKDIALPIYIEDNGSLRYKREAYPLDVEKARWTMETSKLFQYYFTHILWGPEKSKDVGDISYGGYSVGVTDYSVSTANDLKGWSLLKGSDGKNRLLLSVNNDYANDPTNVFIRALKEIGNQMRNAAIPQRTLAMINAKTKGTPKVQLIPRGSHLFPSSSVKKAQRKTKVQRGTKKSVGGGS